MDAQADQNLRCSHMPEDISALRGSSILLTSVTLKIIKSSFKSRERNMGHTSKLKTYFLQECLGNI